MPGGYFVREAHDQGARLRLAMQAKVLTDDEACRVTVNITRVPDLLRLGNDRAETEEHRCRSRCQTGRLIYCLKLHRLREGAGDARYPQRLKRSDIRVRERLNPYRRASPTIKTSKSAVPTIDQTRRCRACSGPHNPPPSR
jgi:hypothetical protein